MQENQEHPGDSLNELERRLTSWQADNAGLSAEAMLFAAGRASARRPIAARFAWPAVATGLTVLAAGFAVWAVAQKTTIDQLRAQLESRPPADVVPAPPESPPGPWHPSSYLALRQQIPLRDGPDLLASRPTPGGADALPTSPTLRPFDPDSLTAP